MIAPPAPALIARLGWPCTAHAPRQAVAAPRAPVPAIRRPSAPPGVPTRPAAPSASLDTLIDETSDETPAGFLGWFDSSYELRSGLQVVELGPLPEGVTMPLT